MYRYSCTDGFTDGLFRFLTGSSEKHWRTLRLQMGCSRRGVCTAHRPKYRRSGARQSWQASKEPRDWWAVMRAPSPPADHTATL